MDEIIFEMGGYGFRRGDIDLALYLGYSEKDLEVLTHFRDPQAQPQAGFFQANPASLEAMTTVDGTQVWRNPRLLP